MTLASEPGREESRLGDDCHVDSGATLGYGYDDDAAPTSVGDRARIRSGTVVYADVSAGDDFRTGHHALVRADTTIGDDVLLGTNAVLDGEIAVGSKVSVQTGVYVPPKTVIGDRVFLGPQATLTNDPYPLRGPGELAGPTLEDGASIGANATLMPDVTVGEDAFVAGGAVVVDDVPENTLAVGTPASIRPIPEELAGRNSFE